MKKADYFTVVSSAGKKIRCELCPHHCLLTDGKTGICMMRKNEGGVLYTLTYCRPVSTAVDPVEKKPLYHFYPGSSIFSSGPNGCTFKCCFCQNCEISQMILPTKEIPAKKFAGMIIDSGTIGIAYTYSEPYIWFETIMEVGAMVREKGLKNVMVTNGFMEAGPLNELLTLVDAMNIDIKSMNPAFYRRLCKARLEPVLKTCEAVKKKCHLEITNLLITDENDSEKDIKGLVDYVAANLGKDTPLHFSRYFPRYKMYASPTPQESLLMAYQIAKEKLDYVYLGNVDLNKGSDTHCPSCGNLLVQRRGYSVSFCSPPLKKNPSTNTALCPKCGFRTNIVIAG
ncbi:MAG TPA: AmmeMemoRadiSam system radical SAM enzyme [Chitinivibrionales bacterium]|nr:AmmeMemoRadiSam system radical SAM enzyme [Chitinivibrionales bacterium]